MITYKTITYHYPKQKIEIDYRGNGKFSIWSIDDTGSRDYQPIYQIFDPRVKIYPNLSSTFANSWVSKNK